MRVLGRILEVAIAVALTAVVAVLCGPWLVAKTFELLVRYVG